MHVTKTVAPRSAKVETRYRREGLLLALMLLMVLVSGTASAAQESLHDQVRTLREKLLVDPYRPGYHFAVLEGRASPFDPNGAIFWKGRYHLFYIFQNYSEHSEDPGPISSWGHISSIDLVHWRHHPTGLVDGIYSGNTFINKDGVPTICYYQVGQGAAIAVALDDELNYWKKLDSNPITPETTEGDPHHGKYRSFDPHGWVEGDTYYAIFGGKRPGIAKSDSLDGKWEYVGDLMAHSFPGVDINEDVSTPDLFKLGNKHMLLCISHRLGTRYYLGQWKNEQFYPESHEQMSWVDNAFFSPESVLDDKGRRIMFAWIRDTRSKELHIESGWRGTMSLPRVIWLAENGTLRMSPPEELKMLRYNPKKMEGLTVQADSELPLNDIRGNSIEISIEMLPDGAEQFGVKVSASPDGQEETVVFYDANDKKLKVDTTRSSLGEGPKSVEAGPFELKPGEPLELRVFVDKSVVEVFANNRQAVSRRIYPTRKDSLNVVAFSKGGSAKILKLEAWDIMPSNPY